jgi:mannose-6-phosphate isomerase-like protein (cupin superfamily)
VADRCNKRVQIFDQNGKFLGKWTDVGSPFGLYYVKGENALYKCDGVNQRIVKLNLDGQVLGGTEVREIVSSREKPMKSKLIGLLLVLPLAGAEPAGYKYWSAAELKGMSKPLSVKAAAHTSREDLADFGVDHALMIHRDASGVAELHEAESDLMVIVSGNGELIVGGTMPNAKPTTAGEVRGPSIDGGRHQKLSPGDIVHIPPKTPHQLLLDAGAQITYFTLKVKE